MSSRSQKSPRGRILRAAISLFSLTHDIKKVSLESIAIEAGVSPATVYNHFGNRENLIREVARELIQELLAQSRAVIDSDLPFPQKLSKLLSIKTDFAGKNSAVLDKVLKQHLGVFDEQVNPTELNSLSLEFIEAGKKQGYIDSSFSNRTIIEYFDIIRAGIASRPDLAFRFQDNLPFINELTRLILYGLLRKETGPPDRHPPV